MLSEKQTFKQNTAYQNTGDIPAQHYIQEQFQGITVDKLLPSQEGTVFQLPDNPLLPVLGIRPGKTIKLLTRQRFGGPLILKINGRSVAVSRSLASRIIVKKPSLPEGGSDNARNNSAHGAAQCR